jgi:hypothetical protein
MSLIKQHGPTARDHESSYALPLLDAVLARGFAPETCAMDKGYDTGPIHDGFEVRGCRPVVPLKETPAVKRGEHRAPTCEHGTWVYAGADFKRKLTKFRCSTGECKPASVWRKASRLHPLIPRESKRFGDLYRGRGSVERAFRTLEERGRTRAASRSWHREGRASRRPLHPRHARLRARKSAGRSTRGVGPFTIGRVGAQAPCFSSGTEDDS